MEDLSLSLLSYYQKIELWVQYGGLCEGEAPTLEELRP